MSVATTIIAGGAVHSALLAVALATRRRNAVANRLLATLLFAFAADLGVALLYRTEGILALPHAASTTASFSFLYFPLLYLYVRLSLDDDARLTRRSLLHFLPALARFATLLPFYLLSADQKVLAVTAGQDSSGIPWRAFSVLFLIQASAYSYATVAMLWRHARRSERAEWAEVKWMRVMSYLMIAALAVYAVRILWFYGPRTEFVGPMLLSVIVYSIGYSGFRQADALAEARLVRRRPKYEKSTLKADHISRSRLRLVELMETEKPYLDPKLTLQRLATRLDLPLHHLSQLINQELGTTFHDLVNGYRVEEAKRLIEARVEGKTMLEIGFEAGFNSKSAFNAAFKRRVKVSPTEYASRRSVSE